jgi:predicted RNA methylase
MSKRKSNGAISNVSGLYKPANSGCPQYMLSMLNDADRNHQYEIAIANCIHEFISNVGRAPLVADLGCGTGLLTLIALNSGAERVISVDTNITMVEMTHRVTQKYENVDVYHGTLDEYAHSKRLGCGFIDILVCVLIFCHETVFDIIIYGRYLKFLGHCTPVKECHLTLLKSPIC